MTRHERCAFLSISNSEVCYSAIHVVLRPRAYSITGAVPDSQRGGACSLPFFLDVEGPRCNALIHNIFSLNVIVGSMSLSNISLQSQLPLHYRCNNRSIQFHISILTFNSCPYPPVKCLPSSSLPNCSINMLLVVPFVENA